MDDLSDLVHRWTDAQAAQLGPAVSAEEAMERADRSWRQRQGGHRSKYLAAAVVALIVIAAVGARAALTPDPDGRVVTASPTDIGPIADQDVQGSPSYGVNFESLEELVAGSALVVEATVVGSTQDGATEAGPADEFGDLRVTLRVEQVLAGDLRPEVDEIVVVIPYGIVALAPQTRYIMFLLPEVTEAAGPTDRFNLTAGAVSVYEAGAGGAFQRVSNDMPVPKTIEADEVEAFAPIVGQSVDSNSPGPGTEALRARFTYEVDTTLVNVTSCPATAVRFQDASDGEPTRWQWQFSDGTVSQERNPVRTPALHQGDTVTLTVYRGDLSASTTEVITYAEC